MCKALLERYVKDKNCKTQSDCVSFVFDLGSPYADIVQYILTKTYVGRDVMSITNLRLFSILFLYDWFKMMRDRSAESKCKWKRGIGSPYPANFLEDVRNSHEIDQEDFEDIWRARRRILFDVSFDSKSDCLEAGDLKAADLASRLVCRLANHRFGVDLPNLRNEDGVTPDKLEMGYLRDIDQEILKHIFSLDPLLDMDIEEDGELDLRKYIERHCRAFGSDFSARQSTAVLR